MIGNGKSASLLAKLDTIAISLTGLAVAFSQSGSAVEQETDRVVQKETGRIGQNEIGSETDGVFVCLQME